VGDVSDVLNFVDRIAWLSSEISLLLVSYNIYLFVKDLILYALTAIFLSSFCLVH
jgi:hypothetical protein